jgi:hypothetical protein
MLKRSALGLTALFITASLQTYAQVPGAGDRLTASDSDALADARVDLIKATPTHDQEKP